MTLTATNIKQRLRLVILLTSFAVLALTTTAFVIYEIIASSQELRRNVAVTGQMIAAQSSVSLAFRLEDDARELLSSLRAAEHITRATLYSTNNTLFAFYPTNAPVSEFAAEPPECRVRFTMDRFYWCAPVVQDGKQLGTLYLESNLAPIYDRLRLYVFIDSLIMSASVLLAWLLSSHLQKGISGPILQLANTAKAVSERRDYSVRARKLSDDELGTLTDAFNHMLGQIEDREHALEESATRLRLALEASQTGTWYWRIPTNQLVWDEFVYRQFGLEPDATRATFEDFIQCVHPDDRGAVSRSVEEAIRGNGDFHSEFRVVWPDGTTHYLVARGRASFDDQGRAVRMTGVTLDITETKKAEEAHALLAAIVKSSDDAIIGKDLQGTIISWNTGAERMFGYTAQEIVGKSIQTLIAPEHPEEEDQVMARIRGGSLVEHHETVRIRKNGEPVQVALSISPIRNSKGAIVGVSSIARDITERKRAEEVLGRQAAVLREQAQLLDLANVIARDLEGRIILWSAGVEQMYGWSKAEALGQLSHKLLGAEFLESQDSMEAALFRTGEWSGELIHKRRNGERVFVASHWVLHRDERGRPAAILEVYNDITERRLAEEEVRRLNAELEQRVRERTAELTAANDELEAFTYSVSHDLRAPLRHIDAFARIVEEDMAAETSPELRDYLGRIRKGTQMMGRLVDDLLNLSRVGRAQLAWETVDLNVLVAEAIADLRPETKQRDIEWRLEPLPSAACDPGLMKQVFANLLSNAVKYTRPRDKAVIEVGQNALGNERVIYVRDNGVGFNMKHVHKLFGVFERLHRSEEFEGTGIGLATVRRIIQRHGGRIWAKGEPDQGATFFLTFPRLGPTEDLPQSPGPS
ncbi:MAG: PAS domain S-box protein [Verrucomicrobiia bacterium]